MISLFTCLIGIRLIDGFIAFSKSKWRELWASLVIMDECELDGTLELESADCGDTGEPPFVFMGRTIALMSNPEEVVAVTVVCVFEWSLLLSPFWWLVVNRIGLFSLLSAIDISTWGVRKCMGGVALSVERAESPLSLKALALAFAAAASAGSRWAEFDCSKAKSNDEGVPEPGLSKSMPWRLKKWTRSDFIVPAR